MKRLITVITCCIVVGYIFLALYPFAPTYIKNSHVSGMTNKVKKILGLGALFDRPNTLIGKSATYRFYQNGKWQPKQQLLEPLFEDYKLSGNIAALKHCRLDGNLVWNIAYIANLDGVEKMRHSKEYAEFLDHLIYRHNHNIKPDSLEISYYTKNFETDSLDLSLTFKVKP